MLSPALAAVLVLAAWLAGLALLPVPHVWITVAATLVCIVAMVASRTGARRALWFNVAFVIAALGAGAYYLEATDERSRRRQELGNVDALFVVDDLLGVRPQPGRSTTAALYYDDELVYDVVYTIGPDGLRIAPPASRDPSAPCALFFGGSFTFGEGVEDDQTMPYLAGRASGLRVLNFGVSGYGPHQMLAAIEGGLVERLADCRPRWAVYQAVYHHVLRAAGKWSWDRHGPRFVLREDGIVERTGNFDFDTPKGGLLESLPDDSFLAEQLEEHPEDVGVDQVEPADATLFHAIVNASHRLLTEIYPNLEMHVIYWDVADSIGPEPLFAGGALHEDIVVHRISDILPEVDDWEAAYKLPHDVHPTTHTHALIAEYVAARILVPDGS